jgi:hypothetical protein
VQNIQSVPISVRHVMKTTIIITSKDLNKFSVKLNEIRLKLKLLVLSYTSLILKV